MSITGTLTVPEKGTIFFGCVPKDNTGVAVIPTAITWKLTDERGTVINSRSAVVVTPAAAFTIVLTNADNALLTTWADTGRHFLLIEWTYTDVTHGVLSDKLEIIFRVMNLVAVT
jgi:hypothetical protein